MHPILQVTNVIKYFKDVKAVDGVNLEIQQGEFVALLGPNGAGKTTLVEMIEGIQHPDSGQILINGLSWKNNAKQLHPIIGLSLQETNFTPKITVRETLQLFASFYKLPNSRVTQVLELINLSEKHNAHVEKLSGGQRQRLALGIALLNNARLLLLDEPTTGLDPTARRDIWNILQRLRDEHKISLILTTHYMEEAEFLCERIVMLNKGKILAQGTLNEILATYNCSEIIEFTVKEHVDSLDFIKSSGISRFEWDANLRKAKVFVFDIVSQLPQIQIAIQNKGLSFQSLECRKMTLDDLFIEMTGRRLED
jgi:ABC-2 type transport system ATP-binding protein